MPGREAAGRVRHRADRRGPRAIGPLHERNRALTSALVSAPVRSLINSGFLGISRRRRSSLGHATPAEIQEKTLRRLIGRAERTRFGVDHRFGSIRAVRDYQQAVPVRTYEDLWRDYLSGPYPVCENLTWPGRIPYFALTSGTTQGATKYIPVTREMVASNRKAALTMLAFHAAAYPDSRLFRGRMFFLGGSTRLEHPAADVEQGDLSGIAARRLSPLLRPFTFPPLDLALEDDWDRKLGRLADRSVSEPITLIGGVPSWLLVLFQRILERTGKSSIAEVWPGLELVVHGGVKFDPYRATFRELLGDPRIRLQESYPCSEGFIAFGDPATGLLRLLYDHGLFHEFIPVGELDSPRPTRHWLGNAEVGVEYAIVVSTCAGLWSHLIGDTIRFESLDPPLLHFTGRTKYTLSAFGEHLINEEIEAAITEAASSTGTAVRDWHAGAIVEKPLGHHLYVVEFLGNPPDPKVFRNRLDRTLSDRNADYRAHRSDGVGLPIPALIVARAGGFERWMRSRGKLGGQNKVPRMDNSGELTRNLATFLNESDGVLHELGPGYAVHA